MSIIKLVGEVGAMPGTSGFTMACFKADDVPAGTKLYTLESPRSMVSCEDMYNQVQDGYTSMKEFTRWVIHTKAEIE